MPFVDLPSNSSGGVKLYYERYASSSRSSSSEPPSSGLSNLCLDSSSPPSTSATRSSDDNAPSDSRRPPLLVLSAFCTNATFMTDYVEAFREDYDVYVLEMRAQGRTVDTATAAIDDWVQAADVAFVMVRSLTLSARTTTSNRVFFSVVAGSAFYSFGSHRWSRYDRLSKYASFPLLLLLFATC